MTELRVEAADAINKLTSTLVANVTHELEVHRRAFSPGLDFWEQWHACDRKVRVFFSRETHDVYKRMEVLMTANTGISDGQTSAFVDVQTDALRSLYAEAGVIGPPFWARIRRSGKRQWRKRWVRVTLAVFVLGIITLIVWWSWHLPPITAR